MLNIFYKIDDLMTHVIVKVINETIGLFKFDSKKVCKVTDEQFSNYNFDPFVTQDIDFRKPVESSEEYLDWRRRFEEVNKDKMGNPQITYLDLYSEVELNKLWHKFKEINK